MQPGLNGIEGKCPRFYNEIKKALNLFIKIRLPPSAPFNKIGP
jgi:hypothetical protein